MQRLGGSVQPRGAAAQLRAVLCQGSPPPASSVVIVKKQQHLLSLHPPSEFHAEIGMHGNPETGDVNDDKVPKLRLYEWPLGEILRFRAEAKLHPDHLWLRLTRVIITGPGKWQRDPNNPGKWEWRQLAYSFTKGEEKNARTIDLEPLPPNEARGLMTKIHTPLRLRDPSRADEFPMYDVRGT